MRTMGKHTVPERTYDVIESLTCCLCGRPAPQPDADDTRWSRSSYDVDGVTIEHRKGDSFPEGSTIDTTGYDVCPTCWDSKVVPFFDSHQAENYTEHHER